MSSTFVCNLTDEKDPLLIHHRIPCQYNTSLQNTMDRVMQELHGVFKQVKAHLF